MTEGPGRQADEMFCRSCGSVIKRDVLFCPRCGAAVATAPEAAPRSAVAPDDSRHPVSFEVDYPEHLSRLTTFFRLFLAIPQFIIVNLLLAVVSILSIIAWFSILFTGRYPKGLFDFAAGVMRWNANVGAYAALLRDEYPPFSWDPGEYPLTLGIERAERQSRFRLFIRIFAIVPNQIVFYFVQLAWIVVTVAVWFVILITGRYPRSLFRFSVGALRWYQRQFAYQYLLRDEYPPYSIRAAARPGHEVLSAIIGLPLFIAYIALTFLPYAGLLGGGTDTVLVQSALTSPALAAEMPTGKANGVRVTILGYNDNTPAPPRTIRTTGYRFVAFHVLGEKDGFLPTVFTPFLFRLHDDAGFVYFPETIGGDFVGALFWWGGKSEGVVVFQIPLATNPSDLIYQSGFGEIKFLFDDAYY